MDQCISGRIFPKLIKLVNSMINGNKEIEEGNFAATYFHGEFYGKTLGIEMDQELVEISDVPRPQTQYIIDI